MTSVTAYFNTGNTQRDIDATVRSTDFTAARNTIYKIDDSLTVTLPLNPIEGDWVGFRLVNGYTPSADGAITLGRNGEQVFDASEDGTWDIDMNFTLEFNDTDGWSAIFN